MPCIRRYRARIARVLTVILPLAVIGVVSAIVEPRVYLPMITGSNVSAPTSTIVPPTVTPPSSNIPAFRHVFIIMMENEAIDNILGNTDAPYINSLAQQYAVAAQYYGITHPSLPNYIAAISGDTQGITNNCNDCFIDAPNISDQIEAAGKTWKAYMEAMPSPCFVGDSGSLYRQKHNPFIYFDSIRNNPARCANIVPFTQFAVDLEANALPDYIWITPDMCNSIHDCPLKTGDTWLQTWISKILAAPAWQQNGVLFLTFDESNGSDTSGCCVYAAGGHILTMVISPLAKPAYQSQIAYSHYSLLRTIEAAWGMPLLGKASCDCSQPMTDFFTSGRTQK
jgi:phosphatidylinositol-3-phosphatase